MRSLRPCSDSSATPSFPSQPEGKIGLPRANPRGRLRSPSYSFLGWNRAANGSGDNYGDAETVRNLTDRDGTVVTLYAQWTQAPTHTITFEANDGSGRVNRQTAAEGVRTHLAANMFTREHYAFSGWNTAADGSGTAYADRAAVSPAADLLLYAQWTPDSYTVRFDANGGHGYMADQVIAYTPEGETLQEHRFTRDGHGFTGWNTHSDGSGIFYTDG